MAMQKLSTSNESFEQQLTHLLHWDMHTDSALDQQVAAIVGDVRQRGDAAVLELTNELDRRNVKEAQGLQLPTQALLEAWQRLQPKHQDALQTAAARIRVFHRRQLESSWSFEDELGNRLGQRISPLQNVGVYVPGGQAAYPSSVLMTLIPAKVAGVENIVVTTPTPDEVRSDMVMAALYLGGADQVFTIGGAQAIAALAYGTASIPRVDKIVGPGGAYVATAKKQVFGQVGIDMIAGPSEVLILADGTTPVDWAVMDLFSQAEHDRSAQSILISDNHDYIEQVAARIDVLLPQMARADIIQDALTRRGALIQCADKEQALALANRIAPEHLELCTNYNNKIIKGVKNVGSIFIGKFSPEAIGDYIAGPNHVLPTSGSARFSSPLGVYDFQKRTSVIECSEEGASDLGRLSESLAKVEGLEAHARSAAYRSRKF